MTDRTAQIIAEAYASTTHSCFYKNDPEHENCQVINYHVAEKFFGSTKSHKMVYSIHSNGKLYAPAGPSCGSKKKGQLHRGTLGGNVTCGRC